MEKRGTSSLTKCKDLLHLVVIPRIQSETYCSKKSVVSKVLVFSRDPTDERDKGPNEGTKKYSRSGDLTFIEQLRRDKL